MCDEVQSSSTQPVEPASMVTGEVLGNATGADVASGHFVDDFVCMLFI